MGISESEKQKAIRQECSEQTLGHPWDTGKMATMRIVGSWKERHWKTE